MKRFMNKPLICIKDLDVVFDGKKILDNINLDIFPGEIVSIIGLNGSGKSTLLKTIIGVYKPNNGKITLFTNKIGYVPQKIDFERKLPLSVYELLNAYSNKSYNEILLKLREFNEDNIIDQKVGNLSGGQIQKILLINALLTDAELLLLDEPTTGIDVLGEKHFYDIILQIKEKYNISILMVSHDTHNVFDKSNKIYCLNHNICCSGTPQMILQNYNFKQIFGKHLSNYIHKHDK